MFAVVYADHHYEEVDGVDFVEMFDLYDQAQEFINQVEAREKQRWYSTKLDEKISILR